MADTEYLKTFTDGETILASDTNNNNEYLLNQISSNAAKLTTYVDGQVSSLNTSLLSQLTTQISSLQNTINTSIDSSNTRISNLENRITFSSINNGGASGYFKLTNGLKYQWGWSSTHQTDARYTTITFPVAFASASSYIVIPAALYPNLTNSNLSWVYSRAAGSCVLASATSNEQWWIAIGS